MNLLQAQPPHLGAMMLQFLDTPSLAAAAITSVNMHGASNIAAHAIFDDRGWQWVARDLPPTVARLSQLERAARALAIVAKRRGNLAHFRLALDAAATAGLAGTDPRVQRVEALQAAQRMRLRGQFKSPQLDLYQDAFEHCIASVEKTARKEKKKLSVTEAAAAEAEGAREGGVLVEVQFSHQHHHFGGKLDFADLEHLMDSACAMASLIPLHDVVQDLLSEDFISDVLCAMLDRLCAVLDDDLGVILIGDLEPDVDGACLLLAPNFFGGLSRLAHVREQSIYCQLHTYDRKRAESDQDAVR